MPLNIVMDLRTLENLAEKHILSGETWRAIELLEQHVRNDPTCAPARGTLGTAYHLMGRHDKAIQCYRDVLAMNPAIVQARHALILPTLCSDTHTMAEVDAAQKAFNDFATSAVTPFTSWLNDHNPRPRIGYVSADLCRGHPVSLFLEPLLHHHTREVEVFLYHTGQPDDTTRRLQKQNPDLHFNNFQMSDHDLAQRIHADRIDILVDLNMFTDGGRPFLFARKPAPFQVSYLAYPGPTGLEAIDYYLTDNHITPGNDARALRLNSYWCYQPHPEAPEVGPPPSTATSHVTFGCLNSFHKVTPSCLKLWARILAAVPNSHMILHCPEGPHRGDVLRALGVGPPRLEFVSRVSRRRYFETYHRIDIALDTFPFCGGTTTCDALWMGASVITMTGEKPVSNSGASILSAAGLPRFIAGHAEEYAAKAIELAGSRESLAQWRAQCRSQMKHSPLMDAVSFARDVERAFRSILPRPRG